MARYFGLAVCERVVAVVRFSANTIDIFLILIFLFKEDELEFLGRSRSLPTGLAEGSIHPLLVDPALNARGSVPHSRTNRRFPRGTVPNNPQDLVRTIHQAMTGADGAMQLFHHLVTHGPRAVAEPGQMDGLNSMLPPFFTRHTRTAPFAFRFERAARSMERVDQGGYEAIVTMQRWSEEAKTLHGRFETSRLSKLANHVALALLPAAIKQAEEEREAAKVREEEMRQEEDTAKAREEEAAQLKAEEEAAGLKAEEEAARLKAEEEARAVAEAQPTTSNEETATTDAPSADAEMSDPTMQEPSPENADEDAPPATDSQTQDPEAGSSNAPERVTVLIHGNPVDITDTGIDPTFLEALPDDMREEVLNQHVRDQRAARVERPADSQISPEFLDALPPELRAEIIQQESAERARRRPEPPVNQVAAPSDIDAADFLASLDPQLRQVVLMDSDDVFLQTLPSHMIAEAGIFRDNQREPPRARVESSAPRTNVPQPVSISRPPVRDAIQLLDRPAIAVLVRLLFFPDAIRKNMLSKVLLNLCENAKSRTDIFSLLLNILQDGTGDLTSIDKSFAQMSFRSTKPTAQTPKSAGKQKVPPDFFTHLPNSQVHTEVVPELVSQRCLETLTYIVSSNELASLFFLTEHELPAALKRNPSKKGKGKDKQASQTYFPIVLLLGLLDRPSLLKTSSLMEYIVALLAIVTRPLSALQKKKDPPPPPSTSVPETAPTEQPTQTTVSQDPSPADQPGAPRMLRFTYIAY